MAVPYLLRRGAQPPLDYRFTLNQRSPQAAGLLAWWPGLYSRGSNMLRNFSTLGADGAFNIAPVWTPDSVRGAAPKFSGGATDYVDCGLWPIFSTTDSLSISFWVNKTDSTSGDVIGKGGNGNTRYHFYCNANVLNRWSTFVGPTLVPGTWAHILYTWKSTGADTGDEVFYMNGVSAATNPTASATSPAATEHWYIASNDSGHLLNLAATIDDVRIYSGAKDASFAWHLYASQTRWELYAPAPVLRFWFVGAVTGPSVKPDYSLFPKTDMRKGAHL